MGKIPRQGVPVHPELRPLQLRSLNEESLLAVCNGESSSTPLPIILMVLKKHGEVYKPCLIERTVTNGKIQGLTLEGSNVASDTTQQLNKGAFIVSAKLKQQEPLANAQFGTSPAQGSTSNPASPENPQQVSWAPSTPLESSRTPIPAQAPSNSGNGNQGKNQPDSEPRSSSKERQIVTKMVTIAEKPNVFFYKEDDSDAAASGAATPEERYRRQLGIVNV